MGLNRPDVVRALIPRGRHSYVSVGESSDSAVMRGASSHKTAGVYYLVHGTVHLLIVDAISSPSRLEGSAKYSKSAEEWRSLLCRIFEAGSIPVTIAWGGLELIRIKFPGGARKVARASVNAALFAVVAIVIAERPVNRLMSNYWANLADLSGRYACACPLPL